jgi:hypothetical protein
MTLLSTCLNLLVFLSRRVLKTDYKLDGGSLIYMSKIYLSSCLDWVLKVIYLSKIYLSACLDWVLKVIYLSKI